MYSYIDESSQITCNNYIKKGHWLTHKLTSITGVNHSMTRHQTISNTFQNWEIRQK